KPCGEIRTEFRMANVCKSSVNFVVVDDGPTFQNGLFGAIIGANVFQTLPPVTYDFKQGRVLCGDIILQLIDIEIGEDAVNSLHHDDVSRKQEKLKVERLPMVQVVKETKSNAEADDRMVTNIPRWTNHNPSAGKEECIGYV